MIFYTLTYNLLAMKNLFTFLILSISISLFAQKSLILQEDFSSGEFPANGWTIDGHADNWSVKSSSNAEGNAPELRFSWSPQFDDVSRFISPVIDASNISSLHIAFKHTLDNYGGAYEVGLATTSDGGTTWNTAWSIGDTDETAAIDLEITTDLNSPNFQFCFYFSGNSYNLDYWYLDNIMVYAPEQVDAMTTSINIATYLAQGNQYLGATFTNLGLDEITTIDGHYSIDNQYTISETFTDISVATGQSLDVDFSGYYPLTPGDKNILIWFDNVNGGGDDNNLNNDTAQKVVHVATQTTTTFPLFEEFTSSTCSPCASFNSSTFTPFLNDHVGELAVVKYQMSWPSPGDPYYTEEGGVRRAFYGVNAVPQLFTCGANCATTFTAVNTAFTNLLAKDAFITLSANHQVDTATGLISVSGQITPYFNGSDFILLAAVCEKVTTENVATNGETEFHHVMMKMLPDAEGTALNLMSGVPQSFEFTDVDLTGTNVEEMTDLEVVLFVQNTTSKEIFQSTISVEGQPSNHVVTFSVLNNGTPIEGATITTNQQELTTNANGEAAIILEDGDYNYAVSSGGFLEETDSYSIAGQDTTIVINMTSNGITDVSNTISVYPSPAKDRIIVQGVKGNILIFNIAGMLVKSVPANTEKTLVIVYDLSAGTYFIRSSDKSNVGAEKFVIIK